MTTVITRRQSLQWLAATGLVTQWPHAHAALAQTPWPVTDALFGLGIASGDPSSDGMVLWTRLMPSAQHPLLASTTVHWEVAHDAQFARVVQRGDALATPDWGNSVHVALNGLDADRWYYYRFSCLGQVSTTGRTRTAPAAGTLAARLRLVYASCQRWEHGYYAAWRHARQDDPDLVVFVGDYMYEYASPKANAQDASTQAKNQAQLAQMARLQPLPYPRTLQDYRDRYALHKSDGDLQAMHAHCPWLMTWDDHEVENDYVGNNGVGDVAAFAIKRLAAYQAFCENMPLRITAAAKQSATHSLPNPQIYQHVGWGQLADLLVLDARQYRDLQACRTPGEKNAGSTTAEDCPDLLRNTRSFLGWNQERWLTEKIKNNSYHRAPDKRWSIICQQTLFAPRQYAKGRVSTDSWGGYPAAQSRLIRTLAEAAPRNTVLLGGDIHQNYVCRIENPNASSHQAPQIVASEFCGTSISSHSGTTQAKVDAMLRHNPHILLARCEERGYGLCTITPKLWTTELRVLDDPLRADSNAHTQARFVVQDRVPGPQWA